MTRMKRMIPWMASSGIRRQVDEPSQSRVQHPVEDVGGLRRRPVRRACTLVRPAPVPSLTGRRGSSRKGMKRTIAECVESREEEGRHHRRSEDVAVGLQVPKYAEVGLHV